MKRILILSIGLLFAGELEVEGDLKVSGIIDANSNTITNVGTPVLDTDATNLLTVRNMMGMKPERIYTYFKDDLDNFSFTVPSDKFWILNSTSYIHLSIDGGYVSNTYNINIVILPNQSFNNTQTGKSHYTIYEYSISGSGTDQGMDYIVP